MSDVEETIAALTTPKPDSPVCVEARELEWESVKAELLKALHAKALKETNVRFNGDVAEWLERAGEDLRSLTEGEG